MSAFDEHKDELQHYEQMLGAHRGRLAVTLDRVTNAMVLVVLRDAADVPEVLSALRV